MSQSENEAGLAMSEIEETELRRLERVDADHDRLQAWIESDLEDAIYRAVWSALRDAGAVDGHENACTTGERRTISEIAESIYAQVIADYEARPIK